MVTYVFTRRLQRYFYFPSLIHFCDLLLFVSSAILIYWISRVAFEELDWNNPMVFFRFVDNLRLNRNFKI